MYAKYECISGYKTGLLLLASGGITTLHNWRADINIDGPARARLYCVGPVMLVPLPTVASLLGEGVEAGSRQLPEHAVAEYRARVDTPARRTV